MSQFVACLILLASHVYSYQSSTSVTSSSSSLSSSYIKYNQLYKISFARTTVKTITAINLYDKRLMNNLYHHDDGNSVSILSSTRLFSSSEESSSSESNIIDSSSSSSSSNNKESSSTMKGFGKKKIQSSVDTEVVRDVINWHHYIQNICMY